MRPALLQIVHPQIALAASAAVLMLSACGPQASPSSAPATATPPLIDAASVWNGSVEACRDTDTPVDDCLIQTIRASGGSASAVAAVESLNATGNPGYVSAYRSEGRIGIATVVYPFRANTNEGTLLIPASGAPINVDTPPDSVEDAPAFKAFTAANPDATPFAPASLARAEPLGSGQRLVYATPLKTCHACATVGTVEIAYDFDGQGAASGVSVLSVK